METKNIIIDTKPMRQHYAGGYRWVACGVVKVGNATRRTHISAPTLSKLMARLRARGIQSYGVA